MNPHFLHAHANTPPYHNTASPQWLYLGGWLTAQRDVNRKFGPERGEHGREFINLAVGRHHAVATGGTWPTQGGHPAVV